MEYCMSLEIITPVEMRDKDNNLIHSYKNKTHIAICDNQVPIPRIGEFIRTRIKRMDLGCRRVESVVYDYSIDEVEVTTKPLVFSVPDAVAYNWDVEKRLYQEEEEHGHKRSKPYNANMFLNEECKKFPGAISCLGVGNITID